MTNPQTNPLKRAYDYLDIQIIQTLAEQFAQKHYHISTKEISIKLKHTTMKNGYTHANQMKRVWQAEEGVFPTPQDKYIVRIKTKKFYTTLSQHDTKIQADKAYKKYCRKRDKVK